ncbi:MAG TPA: hypothetical protein VGF75_00345 [Candidatus Saccharimonadales bacterium]|jgi:hypothetical protein
MAHNGAKRGRKNGGTNFRRQHRMQIMARLEATGNYSVNQLAKHFGLQAQTICLMRAQPEYVRLRASYVTGVLDTVSDTVQTLVEYQAQELADMVPSSLRVLRDTLVRGMNQSATLAERKMALDATREVLDRNGTFAKVSKSEVHVKDVEDLNAEKQVHDELSLLLKSADAARNGDTAAAKALDAFVQAAGDRAAQDSMAEHIKLDDFTVTGPVQ